jgi:hypothetical protein
VRGCWHRMKRKRQDWTVGDVFTVKTSNARYAVGQVLDHPGPLVSVAVALFDHILEAPDAALSSELSRARLISAVFTSDDLLDSGRWQVVGRRAIALPRKVFPGAHTLAKGGVGEKVIGSFNLATFVEAYFGLAPWDRFQDPAYMDKLLISPARKPTKLIFKSDTNRSGRAED